MKSKSKVPPAPRAIPPNYNCAICDVEWPDHLTVMRTLAKVEERICCPCDGRLKKEAALKAKQKTLGRYTIGNSMAPMLRTLGWIGLAVAVGAGLVYGSYLLIGTFHEKAKEGVAILGPKDVTGTLVTSHLPLKSGGNAIGSAFFVATPGGTFGIMPPIVLTTPDGKKSTDTPVFDKWTFDTIGENKKSLKVLGVRKKTDSGTPGGFWMVAVEGADNQEKKLPVTVLQPHKEPVGATFRLRMLQLATAADGKTTQVSSDAKVEAAFAGGANLSVAFAKRLPAKGLVGQPLISESGELVAVITGLGEPVDTDGTVRFVEAMSAPELLGIQPPAPKPVVVAKKGGASPAPKKPHTSIIPGGNPYDKPEYDDLK